jgi:hypothetical protein
MYANISIRNISTHAHLSAFETPFSATATSVPLVGRTGNQSGAILKLDRISIYFHSYAYESSSNITLKTATCCVCPVFKFESCWQLCWTPIL